MARHPFLSHPDLPPGRPLAIAHRGGQDVAPENTTASFEHAVSLGYRHLETDVHLTRDGELVAFHDPDLSRTCGIDANVAELTASEVADARVAGTHEIPTMAELLERFPTARFNIDAKADDAVEPLVELVRRTGALDRVCLAAFELRRLRRLRRALGPGLLTCTSPVETASLRLLGRLPGASARVAQVPPTAGPIPVVTAGFVRRAHARGVPVHVWTVNERAEIDRLLDLGVDGIMTDRAGLLRDALAERDGADR